MVNPDIVVAQMQGGIIFGLTAALYGEITLKDGRVEQSNFDNYRVLRIDESPAIEVHLVASREDPGGIGEPGTATDRARRGQRDLRRHRQAAAQAAGRSRDRSSRPDCLDRRNALRSRGSRRNVARSTSGRLGSGRRQRGSCKVVWCRLERYPWVLAEPRRRSSGPPAERVVEGADVLVAEQRRDRLRPLWAPL